MRKIVLMIFRRDFRLINNPAWDSCVQYAASINATIAPCFIFSDRQITTSQNAYFSDKAFITMVYFLKHIQQDLDNKITFFHAKKQQSDTFILDRISESYSIKGVFFNKDITPFSIDRDKHILEWCQKHSVNCNNNDKCPVGEGYTIWIPGDIVTKSTKTIPKVFSTFYSYTKNKVIFSYPEYKNNTTNKLTVLKLDSSYLMSNLPDTSSVSLEPPHIILNKLDEGFFDSYGSTRNDYNIPTTKLSVYLKFGVIDVFQVMHIVRKRKIKDLERQLIWREFYYHLAYGYPYVITEKNKHIRPDRNKNIKWSNDKRLIDKWYHGNTGEELVDQAMKSLRNTGYLHNRLRMVVASYLVREYNVDWRIGEQLFATLLIDYDPAQNSGGWQSMDAQIPGQEIKASTQLKKYGKLVKNE
ncbi:deoxyribodipyrimidine photo-lyase [Tetraselmis virus 1]|uniref:Deoxyribodipyrimidine photo-lyase n=1 Tax=Tetraselmis virus 1 TaxID=2060617 RepID=A0A2P0VND8_9VIRU|nr:deoxyribodipyrimidine photo-lyase [Tetraselmis virus 1]AUF82390.1 deoxyribodipyrimidine photo-lyase [Tetraselmis virus 1]